MASFLRLARAALRAAEVQGAAFPVGIAHRAGAASPFGIAHRAGAASFFSSLAGPESNHRGPLGPDGLPTFVDWVKAGAVTPPRDQDRFGRCGSCWAFCTVAGVESANFLYNRELEELSEQQLLDGNHLRNFGCDGGSPTEALNYIKRNGGLVRALDYPYTGVQGPVKSITAYGVSITDHFTMYNPTEHTLKRLVSEAPVIVTIGADDAFMDHLDSGNLDRVLDGPNYTLHDMTQLRIIHCVLVVAYGVTINGEKFWMVKNSHADSSSGFVLIARDTGKLGGAFGIARSATIILKRDPNGVIVVKSDADMGVEPRDPDKWSYRRQV